MLRRQRVRARESFRFGTGMGELSRIRPRFAKTGRNPGEPALTPLRHPNPGGEPNVGRPSGADDFQG